MTISRQSSLLLNSVHSTRDYAETVNDELYVGCNGVKSRLQHTVIINRSNSCEQKRYCKARQCQDQLASSICQLIYTMLPLGLCIDLDLSVDEFKAGECQSGCGRRSQQVCPTTFVKPFEAISMPDLQCNIKT